MYLQTITARISATVPLVQYGSIQLTYEAIAELEQEDDVLEAYSTLQNTLRSCLQADLVNMQANNPTLQAWVKAYDPQLATLIGVANGGGL